MKWQATTVDLDYPVTVDDRTYAEITLRAPNVEALERIEALGLSEGEPMTIGQTRQVIEALATVPPEVIGAVHRDDFARLAEVAVPLLDSSPASAPAG